MFVVKHKTVGYLSQISDCLYILRVKDIFQQPILQGFLLCSCFPVPLKEAELILPPDLLWSPGQETICLSVARLSLTEFAYISSPDETREASHLTSPHLTSHLYNLPAVYTQHYSPPIYSSELEGLNLHHRDLRNPLMGWQFTFDLV